MPSPAPVDGRSALLQLRGFVGECIAANLLDSAAFYADKLVDLSGGDPADVLALAQVYSFDGAHMRAYRLLERHGLVKVRAGGALATPEDASPRAGAYRLHALHLATRSLLRGGRPEAAAELLEEALPQESNLEAFRSLAMEQSAAEAAEVDDAVPYAPFPPQPPAPHAPATPDLHSPGDPGAAASVAWADHSAIASQTPLSDPPRSFRLSSSGGRRRSSFSPSSARAARGPEAPRPHIVAGLATAAGLAFEALENRSKAALYFLAAVEVDARSVEALSRLLCGALISAPRSAALLRDVSSRLPAAEQWLVALLGARAAAFDLERPYEERFERLEAPMDGGALRSSSGEELSSRKSLGWGLNSNLDVLSAKAEAAYYAGDAAAARALAERVCDQDPHREDCSAVLFAALVELKCTNDLYLVAHRLVDANPGSATSWLGVGCYYLLAKRPDVAQRYFHKATKMDARLPSAWIGFGNAFAAQDESDQAMAAYRAAARLLPASHVPPLYIGMEYLRANNLHLAQSFLHSAHKLCDRDPLIHNELGVAAFRRADYAAAADSFEAALALAGLGHLAEGPEALGEDAAAQQRRTAAQARRWESTLVNLGHARRKLRHFRGALRCYAAAAALRPDAPDAVAATAFTQQLMGDHTAAIALYHKALALRPDDAFATEMLGAALAEAVAGPAALVGGGRAAGGGVSTPRGAAGGAARQRLSFPSAFSGARGAAMSPLDVSQIRQPNASRLSVGSNFSINVTMTGASNFDIHAEQSPAATPAQRLSMGSSLATPASVMSGGDSMAMSDASATPDELRGVVPRR